MIPRVTLAAGLVVALAVPASAPAAAPRATAMLRAAKAPAGELKRVAAIPLPGGATAYRFQQSVKGVRVLNGQVVISDPRGAPPDLVADSSKPGIESPPSPRVGRGPAIEAASRSAGVKRLRGARSAEPGDSAGGRRHARVAGSHPLRPAAGRLRDPGRRRLGPCRADPEPAPAREAGTRAALPPKSGGTEQRLLRVAPGPGGQEHPPLDLAAPAGNPSRHQARTALSARQVGARHARPEGERGLQAGARVAGGEALEEQLRGPDDLLPHQSRPALHPAPRVRYRGREGNQQAHPARDRRRVQERQLLLLAGYPEDRVRQRVRGRRRGRRRDPARVRPLDPGRPGRRARVRVRQPGRGDRRGLRRLLGRRDVVSVTGDERTGTTSASSTGTASPGDASSRRFTASAAGARTTTTPCPRPRPSCQFDIYCVGEVWSSALWDLRDEVGGVSLRQNPALLPVHVHDQRALRRRGGGADRRGPGLDRRREQGRRSAPRWRPSAGSPSPTVLRSG